MNNTTILIVDDEEDILEFVGYNLRNEGYNVITTNNGLSAIEIAKKNKPDLIILDVMMPEMDGITTCEKMRTISSLNNTIITFLTARSEDYSQIAGFESGADDYITKPIRPKVLVSRVKALLRRRLNNEVMESLSFGNLSINKEKHKVVYRGENIILAKKEFKLLELLVSMPGKVFTRQEIFEKVWGPDLIIGDRTIDVHIRKIREKLNPDYIKTVKGIGYKFEH
ncbi:MAG: response regulator transcription factor [Flavobacteriales bacterium]